jgi:hypothetical protein
LTKYGLGYILGDFLQAHPVTLMQNPPINSEPGQILGLANRVARWYIFKPKIPTWVNFGILAMKDVGKFQGHLVMLLPFGIFYCHLVYFKSIWYILLPFGIF